MQEEPFHGIGLPSSIKENKTGKKGIKGLCGV